MKMIKKKIRNQSGESISETLVALLISSLALVMLAGAISSASHVISTSKEKMNAYYNDSETMITETGTDSSVTVSFGTVGSGVSQSCNITYNENTQFANTPVVFYQYSESGS